MTSCRRIHSRSSTTCGFRIESRVVQEISGESTRRPAPRCSGPWRRMGRAPGAASSSSATCHAPSMSDRVAVEAWSRELGTGWSEIVSVTDLDRRAVAAVLRDREGTLLLPFRPGRRDALAVVGGLRGRPRIRIGAAQDGGDAGALRGQTAAAASRSDRASRAFTRVQLRRSFPSRRRGRG